jgi:hypothetical protein
MTVQITTKKQRRERTGSKDPVAFAPPRIELTDEEILADLHYPAPLPRNRRHA